MSYLVSIPYKRVTNSDFYDAVVIMPDEFQSPISGSQTITPDRLLDIIDKFQSPISGSQTQSVAQEEPEITVFQSPISGSQTYMIPPIRYCHISFNPL
mgnify:FL=1